MRQVAERLQVSAKTVRRLVTSGRLPGLRIGGQYRVDSAELEAWIRQQAVRDGDSADPKGGKG